MLGSRCHKYISPTRGRTSLYPPFGGHGWLGEDVLADHVRFGSIPSKEFIAAISHSSVVFLQNGNDMVDHCLQSPPLLWSGNEVLVAGHELQLLAHVLDALQEHQPARRRQMFVDRSHGPAE